MTAQDALLALQDVDTAIDQHRHRRANLPERAELADTEAAIAQTTDARDEVVRRRDDIAGRQQGLERDLSASEERMAEINRRLSTGGIAAAREVTALNTSVEHLRARVSDLEDQILAAMEERGPLDEMADATTHDLRALEDRRQSLTEGVGRDEVEIDAEVAELERRRQEAVAAVPADLLATYDRLRARLGGIAVARLVGDHCDGCHLRLPATELDRLKHAPADELIFCDQCGRILVRPPT